MKQLIKPANLHLFYPVLLILIVLTAFLRLQFDFNTGHLDEYDYLFVGKTLLAGENWRTYDYIFGSNLNWYLLGFGEQYLGGLEGARQIAGVFGILSLIGFYLFIKQLWNSTQIAVIATVLFSLQAIHIFSSRFATYDIISLAFFSLSLYPLIVACQTKEKINYKFLLLAITLFSLAVTSKYTSVAYFPPLVFVALFLNYRIALLFGLGVSAILSAYVILHFDGLKILYDIQISKVHVSNTTYTQLAEMVFKYLGLPLLLWVSALIYRAFETKEKIWKDKTIWVFITLLVFSLPIVAYHVNGKSIISLYKHLIYALFFLIPAVAWLISKTLKQFNSHLLSQSLISLGVAGMFFLNVHHLRGMETAYPNISQIIETVEGKLGTEADQTILSEDRYLFRYLGFGKMDQDAIKGTYWVDNNRDGKHEFKDVHSAIWDSKFTYVYLNDRFHYQQNKEIRNILMSRGYQRVIEIPYTIARDNNRINDKKLSLYKRTNLPTVPFEKDLMFNKHTKVSRK